MAPAPGSAMRRLLALLGLFLPACGGSPAGPAHPDLAATDAAVADAGAFADTAAAPDTGTAPDGAAPAPFAVGVVTLETVGALQRPLGITVWYPAAPAGKGEAATYFLGLRPSPHGALLNVPPAPGPFPLVVFSHGHQSVRDQSFFLMEALAAHGYVVVAPDHAGNTLLDFDHTLFDLGTMTFGAMFLYRPLDIKATLDRILQPQPSDPPWLQGLVNPQQIGMIGHSFGAWTTLAVAGGLVAPVSGLPDCATATADPICAAIAQLQLGPPPWNLRDARVKVAIPLAHCFGAHFTLASLHAMPTPILLQAATGDGVCDYTHEALTMQAWLGSPHALLAIEGGTHVSFSNLCDLPATMSPQIEQLCQPGLLPHADVAHPVIARYAIAALDVYLRGRKPDPAVFFTGKLADLPFVVANAGFGQ